MNVGADTHSMGIENFATGKVDPTNNTALVVSLGFEPRYIKVVNVDLVTVWEKMHEMPAAMALKTVTAGTTTIDSTSAITIASKSFTLSAAAAGDGDEVYWMAFG